MDPIVAGWSPEQAARLETALATAGDEVSAALEMLTDQQVGDLAVDIQVRSGDELFHQHPFGFGPLAVVKSSVHGDVEGDFLLLQGQSDFVTLSGIMETKLSRLIPQNNPINATPPDWIPDSRSAQTLSRDLFEIMDDVLREMGNILFGIFLTGLNNEYGLTTYQGVPRSILLDKQQTMLQEAVSRSRRESNLATVIEIETVISGERFHTWLVFMPLMSGIEAICNASGRKNNALRGGEARRSGGANTEREPISSPTLARKARTTATGSEREAMVKPLIDYSCTYRLDLDAFPVCSPASEVEYMKKCIGDGTWPIAPSFPSAA